MGGKRLSKGNSIFFHLAIGIGVMLLLSGCQGVGSRAFHKKPEYMADFQYLERVLSFIGQEKFKSALAENAKFEKYLDDSVNRSSDYDRVIRVSARMNSFFLKKMIQDEKKFFILSKKIQEQDLMMKNLNVEVEKLTWKLQSVTMLLKAVKRLDTENKMLRQQIKDFKEIDLEGGKINADMQK